MIRDVVANVVIIPYMGWLADLQLVNGHNCRDCLKWLQTKDLNPRFGVAHMDPDSVIAQPSLFLFELYKVLFPVMFVGL